MEGRTEAWNDFLWHGRSCELRVRDSGVLVRLIATDSFYFGMHGTFILYDMAGYLGFRPDW